MKELISVHEARSTVLDNVARGPSETVELRAAVGRVLRRPVVAGENIPPFDNSAMDGYAVRVSDLGRLPAELRVVADIPAGSAPGAPIEPGTCARIMTGAMFPQGADAVVPVEWTDGFKDVGSGVTVSRSPSEGQHIRRAGEDVTEGSVVLPAGTWVRPTMVGSMASLGYGSVSVSRRPSVSVVATGSELVDAAESPGPGQIRNSNGPALHALSESAGAQVIHALVAPDDYDETRRTLETAAEADFLLVSGGVSVGARDFVKEALDELGTELLFWRVRQRPGKPLAFGRMGETLVFGLPGNPVSSTVCFLQYVYPAIAKYLGADAKRVVYEARLSESLKKAPGLYHFVPGRLKIDRSGAVTVKPSGPQGSHVYSSISAADCLIHLEEELETPPEVGSMVSIERILS